MSKQTFIPHLIWWALLGFFMVQRSSAQPSDLSQYNAPALELLAGMSIEEKVGQMNNIGLMALATGDFWDARDSVILDPEKVHNLLVTHLVGSVQNLGTYPMPRDEWHRVINTLQGVAREKTPHGIPLLYGIDAVHGANYTAGSVLTPHQIGLAATRNRDLVEQCAAVTAYETRSSGILWNYAPVVDVARTPLWGRLFETFGEDPYLVTELSASYVRGAQGTSLPLSRQHTAVCLKHFWGYGHPLNGKDRSPVLLPERVLRQVHLPPFERAIAEGAMTVMLNSGAINGVPAHADHHLITDLLKTELSFLGFTISDWEDVRNLCDVHQVAENEKEAVRIAVNAGLDMCMDPYGASFATYLIELVNEGAVSMERINDAVLRILRVKFATGLFSEPLETNAEYAEFGSDQHIGIGYEAACESITLLKNNQQRLPLKDSARVLVTGYASNALTVLNGAWSRTWSGQDPQFDDPRPTIYEALHNALGESQVQHIQGCSFDRITEADQALLAAENADVIVVCLGEVPATEKPSDTDDLALPQAQRDFAKTLAQSGKPMVLILVQGRPRVISDIEPLFDAILMAYLPGNEGGRAIAEVLTGTVNPSGKLPITYPRYSGSLWTYDHTKADRRDGSFGFEGFNPQWPFGHGLSYTDFAYSNLTLSSDTLWNNRPLKVSVDLTNVGERSGKEVVSVYSRDHVATIVPAVRQLRRFEKVALAPGERTTLTFTLTPSDLAFVNRSNQWVTEPGHFDLEVGPLKTTFYYYDAPQSNALESQRLRKPKRQ